MGVTRIVRKKLQRNGEAQYIRGEKVWRRVMINGRRRRRKITKKALIDLRARDKFGYLAGYCSARAKEVREAQERERRLFGG